ncbi:glucose 1-dehydrogenase [Roseomonas sp. GC11]|uniref:SDR family NAD(P)-dependent oxidoreductase n=1 Tax=Roseomonas sp. GC11 TaxID=2950546 RepID=UPI00210ED47F|nr:glucose 1-dehydrogenase [Roseomonas sp. GC11]MCQ4159020.1 glucose 1-dehydrogenase [Roseomonas sp. GC11]
MAIEEGPGAGMLAGRVALITGAGHGIGRATARHMAAMGATVGINDLKPEFVAEAVAEIEAAGGRALPVVQNIASREGMRAAVLGLAEAAGRFDILVNNAAWVRYQAVADIQPETVDRMLEVGFKSVIWGIQAAAEVMREGGSIINIASTAGLRSTPSSIVYSGIKAAVMGITRAAAVDLGGRGIRVNAIAPSAVPTEGTAKHRTEEKDQKRIARTPLGRLGTVEDIARAIGFLASDQAGFVTGQVLAVDGGITTSIL